MAKIKKYPDGGYTVPKYTPSESTSTPINKGQQLKEKSNLKKSPQVSVDEYMKMLGLAADAAQFTGVGAVPGYVAGLVPTTYDMIKDLKKGDYDQAALDALGYIPAFKLMKYSKYAKAGSKGVNVANKLNNAINVANTANDINQYKKGGKIKIPKYAPGGYMTTGDTVQLADSNMLQGYDSGLSSIPDYSAAQESNGNSMQIMQGIGQGMGAVADMIPERGEQTAAMSRANQMKEGVAKSGIPFASWGASADLMVTKAFGGGKTGETVGGIMNPLFQGLANMNNKNLTAGQKFLNFLPGGNLANPDFDGRFDKPFETKNAGSNLNFGNTTQEIDNSVILKAALGGLVNSSSKDFKQFDAKPHINGGQFIDKNKNPTNDQNKAVAEIEKKENSYKDYIFSDTLLHKNEITFAKQADKINRKYKDREDVISKNSLDIELTELMKKNEQQRQLVEEQNQQLLANVMMFGGDIKEFKNGGKVEPIYTDNPKDKRLQAYNDSLNLYNSGEDYYNRLKQMSFDTKGIGVSEENLKKARDENYKKYPWDKLNMPVSNSKSGNKFQPLSKYDIYVSDIGNIESNRYKKPVQPVIYKKKEEVKVPIPKKKFAFPDEQEGNEESYQAWRKTLPKNLQYEGDYDLKGFYKDNPNFKAEDKNQHLTDKYKLPNHPTFSVESKYYKEGMPAGKWEGDNYVPINRGNPLPDYLTQTVKTPNGMKTYKRKDTNSAWVEQYKNGGIIKKYINGGLDPSDPDYFTKLMQQQGVINYGNTGPIEDRSYLGPVNKIQQQTSNYPTINKPLFDYTSNVFNPSQDINGIDIEPANDNYGAGIGVDNSVKQSKTITSKNKPTALELAGYGIKGAELLGHAIQAFKKPDLVNPVYNSEENNIKSIMKNRSVDVQSILNELDLQEARAKQNIANNSTSVGVMQANLQKLNANNVNAITKTKFDEQLQNNQYRADEAQVLNSLGAQKVQAQTYAEDLNARAKGNVQNQRDKFLKESIGGLGDFLLKKDYVNKDNAFQANILNAKGINFTPTSYKTWNKAGINIVEFAGELESESDKAKRETLKAENKKKYLAAGGTEASWNAEIHELENKYLTK